MARSPAVQAGSPAAQDAAPAGGSLTLVEQEQLRHWLRGRPDLVDYASFSETEVLQGGRSNITIWLRGGTTEAVLRRPPRGPLLPTAHDVGREFRFISALHGGQVPVPRPIAHCADTDVVGSPFILMEYVDGLTLRDASTAAQLGPWQAHHACESLVGVLVALHAADTRKIGLQLARQGDYFRRQVLRWTKQWEASKTRDLKLVDELSQLLQTQTPGSASTLVHGDYRFDNTLLRRGSRPDVAAVLDWELATVGDPLADLGTLCEYWSDPGDGDRLRIPVAPGVTAHDGFMTSDEVAESYSAQSGRDLVGFDRYRALAAFRLAVILEGVLARNVAHPGPHDDLDQLREAVPVLLERAHARLFGAHAVHVLH